jgi:prepilin-type N-terminal cleavage/methylation domain-containing protein/prepilin-type processing-associated H-X9-DG protein
MKRLGFTLVELLVVIGIIALLIGLLLPALTAANGQSRSVQCLSNLHQLALAAEEYCEASGGYLPIAYFSSYTYPLSVSYNWDFTVTTNVVTGAVTSQPGILWPNAVTIPVQQCPSYFGPANAVGNPFTGYNYNDSYLGGGKFGSAVYPPMKMSNVGHPSRCALFGDGQYYNGADKFMRSPFPGPVDNFFGYNSPTAGTQGFRHRGMTNAVFCDGHGESLGTCYTTTSDTHALGTGTGFLSADNSLYSAP